MNKYEVYANANRSGESMAAPTEGTGAVDAIDKSSSSLERAGGPGASRPLHHLWPWAISLILFLLCGYLAFLHPRATITPLDLPESSPKAAMQPEGRKGV